MDGVEVRTMCRPVKLFRTKQGEPFLYGAGFVFGSIVTLKQERDKRNFSSLELQDSNHEKQPQTKGTQIYVKRGVHILLAIKWFPLWLSASSLADLGL